MDSEARITELEILLAHQQRMLEELNAVVIEQAGAITKLSGDVERLKDQLIQLLQAEPLENAKPPHH